MFGFGSARKEQKSQERAARAAAERAVAEHPRWIEYTSKFDGSKATWAASKAQVNASFDMLNAWILIDERKSNPLDFVGNPLIVDGAVNDCITSMKIDGYVA